MLPLLVITLLAPSLALGQDSRIKPLFPPENLKPFPPISHKSLPMGIGGGIMGTPGVVQGLNDIGGGGMILDRPDFVDQGSSGSFPADRMGKHTRTKMYRRPDDSIDAGIGSPGSIPSPRPRPRPQPYPVPYPVPMPQPRPERQVETIRVPYPVRIPTPVRVPQPITVRVPKPVQIRVPQPYPVNVPQPYPVPVASNTNTNQGGRIDAGIASGGRRHRYHYDDFDNCVYRYGAKECCDSYGYFDHDYCFDYGLIGMPSPGFRPRVRGGMMNWWMAREFMDNMDFPDFGDMRYLAMMRGHRGRYGMGGFGRYMPRFDESMFGRYGMRSGFMGGFGAGMGGAFGGGFRGGLAGAMRRRGGKGGEGGSEGEGSSSGGSGGYYWDYSSNSDNDD